MPTKTTEAIILARSNYGEADKLITAFSRDEGKIKIIAKGCRKIKSKMACHIEPFCIGKYFLVKGKTFYTLAGAETVCANTQITENIDSYKASSYICELLQLAYDDGQSDSEIYALSKMILSLTPSLSHDKISLVLRYFEYKVLSRTGYKPDYLHCKKCGSELSAADYFYGSYEGFYCHKCDLGGKRISKDTLKILRMFDKVDVGSLLKLKIAHVNEIELKELSSDYLRDILSKQPRSMEL